MKICNWHMCDVALTGRQSKFCSVGCKTKLHVAQKRRNLKAELVKHHGGRCIDCGYIGPAFMYDFDHRDPDIKEFNLSRNGHTRSYDSLLSESLKCDLVCANCHRFRTHIQRCNGCEFCIPR